VVTVATHCPAVGVPHVVPCDPAELAPLVAWLERREAAAAPLAFPRGTVLPDGRLDLCKQSLGPDGARRVLSALRGHPAITSVLFGTGAIGNTGAAAVADALDDGVVLDTVYLGCNRIDHAGVAALAGAIARSRVNALWLKRNPLGTGGARAIAALIRGGTALRVLDLFNCELDDEGVAIVAEALADPASRIEHVYLGGNAAGWRAARALAELLATTRTLASLGISASRLGDDGAIAVAEGLARNTSLRELGLASNAIGPRGAAAIARAAAQHPRLAVLDLGAVGAARALGERSNHLGNDGAVPIAELIAATTTLRALDLMENGITSNGALPIARAVEQNTSLVELALHYRVAKTIRRRIRTRLAANAARIAAPAGPPAHIAAIRSVYRAKPRRG
jgi:Ran GTPase-activating protein (RanGAP) involved in mRNA processing and transport